MDPLACSRLLRGVEDRLDPLPGGEVDQWFVAAGVVRTLIRDEADVVGVAEDLEERRPTHWPGRSLRCRDRCKPTGGRLSQQFDHAVLAGGVLVEGPADERRSFFVDLDGPILASLLILRADVEVAEGCAHGCAAGCDLLGEPLRHLGGEILGVELGNRRHDPVQQHP